MSVKVTTKVWEWSQAEGNDRLMLLALADWTDDDGFCYPGITRLAKKCRISERTAQRCIATLKEIGELLVDVNEGVAGNGGKTNKYQVVVKPPGGGVNLSPGDNSGQKVVTPVSSNTSVDTSERGATPLALAAEPLLNGEKRKADSLFIDLLPDTFLESTAVGAAWKGFVDMRRKKYPLTDHAVRLIVKKLQGFEKTHGLPGVIDSLNGSTVNNWRDVFEPKTAPATGTAPKTTANSQTEPPRYQEFIKGHPVEKVRTDFPTWAKSAPATCSWLRLAFQRWSKTGKYE